MPEKVQVLGIKRELGWLYFVDEDGDVAKFRDAGEGERGGEPEKVARLGLRGEPDYIYFLDPEGDISRAALDRRRHPDGGVEPMTWPPIRPS